MPREVVVGRGRREQPSEQSRIRSPAPSSRVNTSGSGSCTPSTARRIRLRCGWTRASSSVIRPSSIRLCTKVWSLVSWRERAVAQQVAAAVADVADADLGAVEERRGDGRAGAVDLGVLLDQLGDPVVGAVDRAGERLEHVVARAGRRARRSSLDRGAAGDVAAGRAAHAVGDHEQVLAGVARSPGCPCGPGRRRTARRSAAEPVGSAVGRVRRSWSAIGYFLSSRMVLPIRTWLPSWRAVGWVMPVVPT